MSGQQRLIRKLLLYAFELGHNTAGPTRNICHTKGEEGEVNHTTPTRLLRIFRASCKKMSMISQGPAIPG